MSDMFYGIFRSSFNHMNTCNCAYTCEQLTGKENNELVDTALKNDYVKDKLTP